MKSPRLLATALVGGLLVVGCSSGGSGAGGGGLPGVAAHGTIACGATAACNVSVDVCCAQGTPTCTESCPSGGFTCIAAAMCPGGTTCCMNDNGSACRAICEPGEGAVCEVSSGDTCGDAGLQCGTLGIDAVGPGYLEFCQP